MNNNKKLKIFGTISIALTILLLLSSVLILPIQPQENKIEDKIAKENKIDHKQEVKELEVKKEEIKEFYKVKLITGDIVNLANTSKGLQVVSIEPADPLNKGQSFQTMNFNEHLYVIPSYINKRKYDLSLFDVTYLVKEKYYEMNSIPIILKARDSSSIATIAQKSSELKIKAKTISYQLNLISLEVKSEKDDLKKVFKDMLETNNIDKVWLDKKKHINLDVSVPKIGSDLAWIHTQSSGEGVKIAILDTGIDLSHKDFYYMNGTSKILEAVSMVDWPEDEINNPIDYHGHGTHVSGIAAGTGLTLLDPNYLSPIAHPLIKRRIVQSEWNDEAAIVAGNGTHLIVVWHSDVSGNWEIWYTIYDGVTWNPLSQLTTDPNSDRWPYVSLLSNNRILIVWVSNRTGNDEIWYKVYINGMWTEDKQLTTGNNDYDYSPAFTELIDGNIAMIWSSEIIGTNTTDVFFAKLTMQPDGSLTFIDRKKLTEAATNTWFTASSILLTDSGRLWAFWFDLSHYDFTTHWGSITTMYYNFSDNLGGDWNGGVLYTGSGCIGPYGVQLQNGTLVVFFSGDDYEHNVPDTTYYLRLKTDNTWEGPFWLSSDVWHRWRPTAAYGPGGLYVTFTAPGRPWEYYGNDIYITTPKPKYVGVAPKADLLEVKVLNKYGWGYDSWIIAGIEWAVKNGADIISMSIVGWPTDGTDPLSQAVDWAFDQGVLVVVAAGNEGQYFGVTAPGAARKALTVGAVDDSDNIAGFSSRGPTLDYRVKPEIVAPGVDICSSVPEYLFGSPYECWSGTSMATPHVAGAAALAKQFCRVYFGFDASPEVLKNSLLVEATDDLGYNVYEQGAGRLNITKLFAQSSIFGYGGGWIYPAVINFGPIVKGEEISAEISIQEFMRSRTYYLELEVREAFTGELRNELAQLSTTTLEIEPGEQKMVTLTILPYAPAGVYSGKIRIMDNYSQTYNVIFGFTILNRLTIHKIPWEGEGQEQWVAKDFVEVTILDPDSEDELRGGWQWGWFDENGYAYFFLPDGTYEIYTVGEYNYKPVFLAYDNLILTDNTEITLDERSSYEVVFDPAKTGQIFAEVYHGMISEYICPPSVGWCYSFGIDWLGYYPKETSVYYSYSYNLWSIDRYVYYPIKDVNPSDLRVISTDIWHDLLYVEKEICSPINRVADYSQLVTKHTEYRAASVLRQSAERVIWAERNVSPMSTFYWLMNIPYSRLEIVSSDTWYYGFYSKEADLPGFPTPYWEYYGEFWTGGLAGIETKEVWGEQPLFPTVKYVYSYDAGSGQFNIHLGAETFTDSNYWYNTWFHSRYPLDEIDVKILRDGVEIPIDRLYIFKKYWGDYYLKLLYQQPPASYTLRTIAYEGQTLSTETILEYDFRLNSDGSISRAPIIADIDVKDLTLNNTLDNRYIRVKYKLVKPETSITSTKLEYSLDDGSTWREALVHGPYNVTSYQEEYYADFAVRDGRYYVSLRISAQATNEQKMSSTIIKAFYIPYLGSPTVAMLNFDDNAYRMGSVTPSPASKILYFPHFHQDSSWRTYISLVNPNPQPAEVTLTAYSNYGSVIASKKIIINPNSKVSDFVNNIIPGARGTGWVKVVSFLPIIGLLNFDDYSNRMGSLSAVIPSTTIYFPHFHDSGSWRSYLSLVNPSSDTPATINIVAYDNDGNILASKNYNINPLSKLAGFVSTIIGKPSIGSLKITADIPVVAILNFDDKLYRMGSLEPSTPSKVLLYPHVHQDSSWRTYIAIMNTETELRAKVRITLYDNNGNIKGMIERSIPPNGRIAATIQQLFPGFTGAGHIIIESNVPIAGMLNFDDYSNRMGSLPATTFESERIIAHFHQGGGWRSYLAIVNYGDKGRTISINYLDKNGNILNSQSIYLNPENKRGAFTIQGVGWISIDVAQND